MKEKRTSTPNSSTLGDALWLAGRDIRASWLSYPAAVMIALFFGLLGAMQFGGALAGDGGAFNAGLLDFYLMCLVSALGTNLVFNRDYYSGSRVDSFDHRLSFLRSLPVNRRSAVVARTICALLAVAVATPAFFAVPYLLSGGLREIAGVGGYVCFCCFWVGYAMVTTGLLYIYGSFAVRWNYVTMPLIVAGYLGSCVLIPVAFRYVSGDGIALTILRVSGSDGLAVAAASLFVGAVVLVFSMRKAESDMVRRDVG